MIMGQRFLVFAASFVGLILMSSSSFAIQGASPLEEKLMKGHQELQALDAEVRAQESLIRSSRSGFYPTLNAVGGWAHDDDLETGRYQGAVGYLEGRWNLFRGFKDQALVDRSQVDVELKKIDLEVKKRSLQLELTQVLGEMIFIHRLSSILDDEGKFTQTQRQMAAKKVSAGLTGQVDNYEFDLRESELEIQKRQYAQRHLEAHQRLEALIGESVTDAELEKIDFENVPISKNNLTWDPSRTLAFQRSDLLLKRAELDKKEVRADFLPSLDFEYRYGHLTPGETDRVKFDESRYGLFLTIPLFSGFDTVSKTRAQTFNVAAREKDRAQALRDHAAEFKTLQTKWTELNELSVINEKRLESAKKYYELTLSEYRRGIKNSPDLVGATERWFESQKRKFEIKKDLEEIRVKLAGFY
jgi:outer membrane protein